MKNKHLYISSRQETLAIKLSGKYPKYHLVRLQTQRSQNKTKQIYPVLLAITEKQAK